MSDPVVTVASRTWFTARVLSKKEKPDPAEQDEGDEDEGPVAEVLIYDEIGMWGIGAADFDRALKALGDVKTINMRINSPGGDSFAGIAIYNTLKAHPATIRTTVDGLAASAASLIAMAGDRIVMPENTFMVVHEPLAFTIGPASVHRAMADDLDRVASSYASTYVSRSGQTLEAVRSLMAEDRLMTASECKERGYCDEMTAPMQMSATFDLERIPAKHRGALASVFATTSGDPGGPGADPAVAPGGSPAAPGPATDPGSPETPGTMTTEAPELDTPALIVTPPLAAYGEAEITATLELCALAGQPATAAQRFIAAKTPVAKVRQQLLEARAAAGDAAGITIYTTNEGGGIGGETGEQIVAGKRRLQAIIKRAERDKIPVEQAARLVDQG